MVFRPAFPRKLLNCDASHAPALPGSPCQHAVGDRGELVPIPDQQAALRRMQQLRDQGLALRAIADRMKSAGVSISHAGVKNALAAAQGRP